MVHSSDERSPMARPHWSAEDLFELASRFLTHLGQTTETKIPLILRECLRSLGTRLRIDRTTLYTITPDRRGFRVVASWSDNNIPRLPNGEYRAHQSHVVARALRGEPTRIARVDSIASTMPEDYALLQRLGQKSLLVMPLRVAGGTVGCLTLGGVSRHLFWPRSFIQDLQLIVNVMAIALQRVLHNEQLAQERSAHDQTQRIAGLGHWRYDFLSRTTQGSAELYRALHLDSRADLDLGRILTRIHPEDRTKFSGYVDALLRGSPIEPIECRVLHRSGQIRWFRCWGEVTSDSNATPTMAHGVLHDITERKLADDNLETTNRRLVKAQEDERARLGRELHDDLGQRVAALALRLDTLQRSATEVDDSRAHSLTEAIEQLSELGLIVRDLSHSLHPADLRRLGLGCSLASLCRRCSMSGEVDVVFAPKTVVEAGVLPEAFQLALFRVAQESVSNALRHSKAQHITVSTALCLGSVSVTIADDGTGFIPGMLDRDRGLGLMGMEERMRLVGGVLEIDSQPGKGTRVFANIEFAEPKVVE